jgi:hypothetical protein
VAVQLPLAVDGYVQFKPDPTDSRTTLAGVQNRVGCKTPQLSPDKLQRLSEHTLKFCKRHFKPLPSDTDLSVDTWLESCPYPLWRKDELRAIYKLFKPLGWKDCQVKAFVKDEFYPEVKHSRGIYSRTDRFKIEVGPIFRAIEREIYKHPAFIKKIPIADRPKYIQERIERTGAKYGAADYTAFESHFVKEMMQSVEFVVYKYMTQYLAMHAEFTAILENVIAGENACAFNEFWVYLEATRMSGEMNTSIGNGATNLIVLDYLFSELGIYDVRSVVEGDDSLFSYSGGKCPTVEMFAEYGFTIKMDSTDDLSEASFCGLVFDPVDLINITDPIDALVTFGWAGKFYTQSSLATRMKLLRCKSLSYAHQYPGCPILASLAKCGLRMTKSYDVSAFIEKDRGMCMWERDQMRDALNENARRRTLNVPDMPVPMRTRLLMQRLYGISPEEQLRVEAYLDSHESGPLAGPVAELVARSQYGPLWADIFRQYSEVVNYRDELQWCRATWSSSVPIKGEWALSQEILEIT